MFVDYKCTNEKCEKFNVEETLSVRMSETDNQFCEKCKEKLQRVWNSSIAVKTSDGYKS